jgi:hypothetical protein
MKLTRILHLADKPVTNISGGEKKESNHCEGFGSRTKNYLTEGWQFVSVLPSQRILIRKD